MSFKSFLRELNGNRVEGELLKASFYSLLTSLVLLSIIYFLFLNGAAIGTKLFFVFMSVVSYALLLPAMRQIKAYSALSCNSGMMVGMTIGMVAGFLPGFYVASTNGMFFGAVWGMILGIFFGIINGKSCGIMGIMEGIMAGFMGGLMGGMTSIMLLNDHLIAMSIIVFIVCALIVCGLNYMVYLEMRNEGRRYKEGYVSITIWSFVLTLITCYLIFIGPRGGIFA